MKTSRFLAKLIGLTGIVGSVAIAAGGATIYERLIDAMDDPGFMMISGIYTLIMGMALVVGHNVWDRSWRVVITVFGYLAAGKGFILLAWPDALKEFSIGIFESGVMPFQLLFALALYGWITWLGFRPEKSERSTELAA